MRGAPEEREADKGEVAIYNLSRIQRAAGAPSEAARLRARAAQDLRNSVWAPLFA